MASTRLRIGIPQVDNCQLCLQPRVVRDRHWRWLVGQLGRFIGQLAVLATVSVETWDRGNRGRSEPIDHAHVVRGWRTENATEGQIQERARSGGWSGRSVRCGRRGWQAWRGWQVATSRLFGHSGTREQRSPRTSQGLLGKDVLSRLPSASHPPPVSLGVCQFCLQRGRKQGVTSHTGAQAGPPAPVKAHMHWCQLVALQSSLLSHRPKHPTSPLQPFLSTPTLTTLVASPRPDSTLNTAQPLPARDMICPHLQC